MATALLERVRERHVHAADLSALERRPQAQTDSAIREGWIQVGKINMHYLEKGPADGPVIVLLQPSGNADPWAWEKVMKALPDNYRLLAPGFQGFGKTALPKNEQSTVENLSESVKDFLSAKGVKGPVWMMGSSAGAFVAMVFAAQNPGRVERLAVTDAYAPTVQAEYPWLISRVLSHPELSRRALHIGLKSSRIIELSMKVYEQINRTKVSAAQDEGDKNEQQAQKSTIKAYFRALRDVRNPKQRIPSEILESTIEYLARLPPAFFHIISGHRPHAGMYQGIAEKVRSDVPIRVVIHGEGDIIVPKEASIMLAELLGVEPNHIEGAGHSPHENNTARFMEILSTQFLPKEEAYAEPQQRHPHRSLVSRLLRRENRKLHQEGASQTAA